MPRYLRIADVPAILSELQGGGSKTPYQLNEWQQRWCKFSDEPEKGAAVLSYRWRIRARNESFKDYERWLSDCGHEGYEVYNFRDGDVSVDWSLADGHNLQIEVATWLLWLHTHRLAEYAWVDQMCVPQDADVEEKMSHIKDSPAIYAAGHVYVLIAPVVDYSTGRIMNAQEARAIVNQYNDEMNAYRSARFLSRSAVKALLVNNSYMRRVWTIQEAVASMRLSVWPLKGEGEVNSYQSIYVVDWPEFNAWNSHPVLAPLYLKFGDEAIHGFYEGDYTEIIRVLREHPSDGVGYLAMISKDLMWITMDRNGLINDLKKADSAAKRAFVVLNNHQIQSSRSFLPEDRVLALVPLVDYSKWKEATQGVPGRHLVQASVAWAYGIMESQMATWKWSIRVYNSPDCKARGLGLLEPRRNLGNSTSIYGATPNWELQIPIEGGRFLLTPPPPHPDPVVTAYLEAAPVESREMQVMAALVMPHPGQAKYWGGGPWTSIRDVLQTDEVFRLSVQWGLEPWRNPALGLDAERSAVVVASGGGLEHPIMIILGLKAGEEEPTTGQVMVVVDVSTHLLPALLEGLRAAALDTLNVPITAVSTGIVPPPPEPPSEPSTLGAAWQLVPQPEPEETELATAAAEPAEGVAQTVELEATSATPKEDLDAPAGMEADSAAGQASGMTPNKSDGVAATPSALTSRSSSVRPASAVKVPSERPPSAVSPKTTVDSAEAESEPEASSPPPGATIQKGSEVPGLPNSGVEVAAGAKYAAQVAQGTEGPCRSCTMM
ncbi:hypothetical protein Vafri_15769 [Volvox africanus]|nr:hypothetical protein Vafri_15769 [Volvox africanus]